MTNVLIAGGTGVIGTEISKLLLANNYNVSFLSRKKTVEKNCFFWDLDKEIIDIKSFENVDTIINLTGANISSHNWTNSFKNEILSSRINSAKLIYKTLSENNIKINTYISASAIGYYGTFTSDTIFTENSPCGKDFLSDVCSKWEANAIKFNDLNIRTVILRQGVVFTQNGGAFQKMTDTFKNGLGAVLGTGNQYIPWIHISDNANIFKFVIENKDLSGIYNCVAPEHITNKELTHKIIHKLNKKIKIPNIPAFALKMRFGEMSSIILEGSRVSSEKLINQNFKFKFEKIDTALEDLMNIKL